MNVWHIDEHDYREDWTLEEKIKFWLRYAILAPSPHNNQPWKVTLTEDGFILKPDMQYVGSGTPRLTVICLGSFVENFATIAANNDYATSVSPLPHATKLPTLEIKVSVHHDVTVKQNLFALAGILKRHTNRGLYSPEPLPDQMLSTLKGTHTEPGTTLHFLTEEESRETIAKMAGQGMRVAVSLPPLRRELARFVHLKEEQSETGMYVEAMVQNPAPSETGADFILHTIDIPGEARFTYEKFKTAPLIVIVSTETDNGQAWFNAGRTIERFLNKAAALGLSHCIAAAPTEIPPFLPRIRHLLDTSERPQLAFRIGIPLNPEFTHDSPRRSVESIIQD